MSAGKVLETQVPVLSRGCRLGKDQVLLMPEGIIKLSATATRILELCDGKRTVAELVVVLQNEYAALALDRIHDDALAYIATLVSKKALELR